MEEKNKKEIRAALKRIFRDYRGITPGDWRVGIKIVSDIMNVL